MLNYSTKIILTIILFFVVTNIFGETRYVSKTAGLSSAPPYTSWATACDSLQKCFDYCNSGDTVYVDRGIYRETIYVNDKNLTIIGVDTDECILDGTGIAGKIHKYAMCEFKNDTITLKNMTLKFKRVDDYSYYYAFFNDGISNLSNCIIDSTACSLGLLDDSIVNNTIMRNTDYGIEVGAYSDPEIEINNCYFYVLANLSGCTVINNGAGGGKFKIYNNIMLKATLGLDSYAISLLTNERIEIKNNLICRFRSAINEGSFQSGVKDTTFILNNSMVNCTTIGVLTGNLPKERIIKNNIMAYSKFGIFSENGYPVTSDYNMYFKNWGSPYYQVTAGEHDLIADPMFNNDTIATLNGNYDYRLQKYSPAIDAGDPSILDVDGSRSDIGMYGGPFGISYVYKDLAPKQVKGLTAVYQQDTNRIKLTWKKNTESDFTKYYIYKDFTQSFAIDSTKRIGILTDTLYYDILNKGTQKVYYKVTAIDSTGNESAPSTEINVTITENEEIEITENYSYQLYQNYPNPFNPTTTISYSLKEPGEVRIKLYTVTGELLKTIIEGTKNKGYNETQIDLSTYSSGIYLYRLEVTGAGKIPVFNDLKKMAFVK